MSSTSLVLILFSAIIHVGWNYIAKRSRLSGPFFLASSLAGSLGLLPVLLYHIPILPLILLKLWPFLMVSGIAMVFYYRSLATAYNIGDLSLVYPLLRSSPIFIVVVMVILGRSYEISWSCLLGILLVIIGCFLLPMKNLRDLRASNYLSKVFLAALVGALATTAYSIADDQSLRLLRSGTLGKFSNFEAALFYFSLWGTLSCCWQGAAVLAQKSERKTFLEIIRHQRQLFIPLGLGIHLGYLLVLVGMTYSRNVSYVVAFRQISIPLGALLGVLRLKESLPFPKLAGLIILLIGLTLVAIG